MEVRVGVVVGMLRGRGAEEDPVRSEDEVDALWNLVDDLVGMPCSS
jgi:hypothetical protein